MFQSRSNQDHRDHSMIVKTISILYKVMFETLGISIPITFFIFVLFLLLLLMFP